MFLLCENVDYNIININEKKFTHVKLKNLHREPHKYGWGYNESEWHDQLFIYVILSLKMYLPFIFRLNADLLILLLRFVDIA